MPDIISYEVEQLTSGEEEPFHGESDSLDTSQSTVDRSVHLCEPFSITSFNNEKLFPRLDVSHLSEDEKQDLEARLLKDTSILSRD